MIISRPHEKPQAAFIKWRLAAVDAEGLENCRNLRRNPDLAVKETTIGAGGYIIQTA